jgi:hypothetical protein
MIETLLFLAGALAGILFAAWRMRVPGEPWLDTIVRPFGAGGPGPRR